MKISNKMPPKAKVTFQMLEVNEVFYEAVNPGVFYLKIESHRLFNTVRLDNAELVEIIHDSKVVKVNAEVIIT